MKHYITDNSKFKLNIIIDYKIFVHYLTPIIQYNKKTYYITNIKYNLVAYKYTIEIVFNQYIMKYELYNLIDNKLNRKLYFPKT